MNYYSISNNNDLDVIGNYPQTSLRKGYNPRLLNSHRQVQPFEFPDYLPHLELEIHSKAVPTNFLEKTGPTFGFIVDDKLKSLLERYHLPPHHFYPIKVYHKEELLDYYWLHWIMEDIWQYVDCEASTIRIQHSSNKNNFVVQPIFSKEILSKLSKYYFHQLNFNLLAEKLVFKETFPKYDILSIRHLFIASLISSRLRKEMENCKMTGYDVKLFRPIRSIT